MNSYMQGLWAAALATAISLQAHGKDITVDPGGEIKTVQAAVDAASDSEPTNILIKPGKYIGRVTLAKGKSRIRLIGQGGKPEDTVLSFNLKAPDPKPDGKGTVGTSGSASVYFNGNDCSAENITFENSSGHGVGQAVAVKTTGDKLVFINCRFLGAQDTLYLTSGRCYLKDCYITGDVDFIFGDSIAVFDRCTINSSDVGYITAAKQKADAPYGYVFLDCKLTASPNVKSGTIFLGRPWQWETAKPAVTYIRTTMGPQINPEGWNPWDAKNNTSPGEHARYSEYGSITPAGKPVDVSKRVAWSKQLSKEEAETMTPQAVLKGSENWDPTQK